MACNNTLFWTEVRSKERFYTTLITSAAKITRQLLDTVNYQWRFDKSQARIKFEYIMMQHIRSFSVVCFFCTSCFFCAFLITMGLQLALFF